MIEGGKPLESLSTVGDYIDPGLCITLGLIIAFLAGLLTAALHKFSPALLMMRMEKGVPDSSAKEREKRLADELDDAERYLPGASFLKLAGLGTSLIGALNLQETGASLWPEGVPGLLLLFVLAALLSEMLPDRITDFRAESMVYRGLPLLRVCRYMLFPATWPLSRLSKVFVRNFLGIREEYEQAKDRDELADEIRAAVEDSDESEVLAAEEKEWIENIVEFREQDVANVMTPRTDIIAVECRTKFKDAVEVAVKAGHSRLPVYEDKLDNIVGIFYLRDAIAQIAREEAGPLETQVGEHSRPPYFVPESKKVTNLLREFKSR
ncbi:MAG: CNNM domain-containing protein, partial [Planctomycetota bacterium]